VRKLAIVKGIGSGQFYRQAPVSGNQVLQANLNQSQLLLPIYFRFFELLKRVHLGTYRVTGLVARRALIGWCRLIRFFMVFDFFVERIERGFNR